MSVLFYMNKINFIGAFGSKGKVGKAAKAISNASGGAGLTNYFGGRGSKRDAVKSAGKVGLTVASLAAGGAVAGLSKAGKAKTVVKHWKDYKGPGKVIGGRGNSVGRSGTSYKPYR